MHDSLYGPSSNFKVSESKLRVQLKMLASESPFPGPTHPANSVR